MQSKSWYHAFAFKLRRFVCVVSGEQVMGLADKPARRESMPKIAPIRRAYNVVADDTRLSSFV